MPVSAASSKVPDLLASLWKEFNFEPNERQRQAILHANGPLFLPAGPGSGKTRVLLWRAVNLISTHSVSPDDIFLSTFTEKAATQLKNGLRTLLGAVSQKTGKPYDTAQLYVGTVHSLCSRLLLDRRLSPGRARAHAPILLDELSQYLFLLRQRNWKSVQSAGPFTVTKINSVFENSYSTSRYRAIANLLSFFNRLSEETIDPVITCKKVKDETLRGLLDHYAAYLQILKNGRNVGFVDLSLLQQATVEHLEHNPGSGGVFRHVIIDEYQDTNPVQERIFFQLARGSKICALLVMTIRRFIDFAVQRWKILSNFPHGARNI
jgi:DNA helicase-2/ATP-dependent DNA helicase PcrA